MCVGPGPVSNGTTSALKCSTGSLFHSEEEGANRKEGEEENTGGIIDAPKSMYVHMYVCTCTYTVLLYGTIY